MGLIMMFSEGRQEPVTVVGKILAFIGMASSSDSRDQRAQPVHAHHAVTGAGVQFLKFSLALRNKPYETVHRHQILTRAPAAQARNADGSSAAVAGIDP